MAEVRDDCAKSYHCPSEKIADRRRSVQILDSHRPAELIKGAVVYLDWTGENHGKSVVWVRCCAPKCWVLQILWRAAQRRWALLYRLPICFERKFQLASYNSQRSFYGCG
jgi:hypothetical protein